MKKVYLRYSVGIDVSKDDFHVCFKGLLESEQEKILGTRKFANTPSGFKAFCKWVESKRKAPELACRMVMEASGVYHESLLYYLSGQSYYISLALAKRAKRYLQSLGYDSKTDKIDAKGLASLALERKLPKWQAPGKAFFQIRQLIRHRKALIESRVSFQNQLHALEHSHLIHADARRSVRKMIKELNKQIARIEQSAEQLLKEDQHLFQRVKSIVDSLPGIGMISLMEILAETHAFSLFTSAKQLVRFAGYDIIESQSGKHTGKTRISKKGNARLRRAMYMPALAHIRQKKGPLYQLYLRLLKRNGGIKKKALVAVQRKLLCLVYTLWKSQQLYDPLYHLKSTRKSKDNPLIVSSPDKQTGLREIVQANHELLNANI